MSDRAKRKYVIRTVSEETPAPPEAPPAKSRREMIAEAAYHRAARRGFQGGDPIEDWLAAEAEIEDVLARGRP